MTIIKAELQRGLEITEKIMANKLPWSDLFVKHTFFTNDFKYYISVISSAKTRDTQNIWSGYIESKVRMLVQKLEQHPHIQLARPFNKGYSRKHLCKTDKEIEEVQEGSLAYIIADNADEEKAAEEEKTVEEGKPKDANAEGEESKDGEAAGPTEVFTTTHYIGLQLEEGKDVPRLDMPNVITNRGCRRQIFGSLFSGRRIQVSVYSMAKVPGRIETSRLSGYSACSKVSLASTLQIVFLGQH